MTTLGWRRISGLSALIAVAAITVSGCAPHKGEASPLRICGQKLTDGYALPVVIKVPPGSRHIKLIAGGIVVQFTENCSEGVSVTFDPKTAVDVQRTVKAADGKIVASYADIRAKALVLRVDRPDGTHDVDQVQVDQ